MSAPGRTLPGTLSVGMHRRIVETANEGIWQIDLDGRTVFANDHMAEMLGCAPEEMPGRAVLDFVFDADRSAAEDRIGWNVLHGRSDQFDFRFRRADGAAVEVLCCTSPVEDDGGHVVGALGMFTDITRRKRVDRRLATEFAVSRVLAEAATLRDAAPLLVRAICECLDWAFGAVWVVGPQPEMLSCLDVWSAHPDRYAQFEALTRACVFPAGVGMPGRVWADRTAQWIPDVVVDRNFPRAAVAADEGLHGAFGSPIVLDDEVLGVMEFFSHEIRQPDAELLELVTAIGSQIGQFAKRRRAETDLRESEGALREGDARKNEFLAMLAHELRNPLAPVRSALEVMRVPGVDEARRRWAEDVVERQVAHLVRLVDDLLDVSRISRGTLVVRPERTDLAVAIAQAVETASPLITACGHALTVRLPEDSVFLDGDPARLAQVFTNLLHNAAKFTPDGGRITLTAEREGGDVVVRVRDSGVGVPPDMLSRVFDLFVQSPADLSLVRAPGGLGVGLTLVRTVVGLHGGSVDARLNEPPPGTEFVVRLPGAPARG